MTWWDRDLVMIKCGIHTAQEQRFLGKHGYLVSVGRRAITKLMDDD